MTKLPTKEDFKKLYGSNGNYSYRAMFWELSTPAVREKYPPVFTLKLEEHEGLPSAYQVYMDSVDEYDAAQKLAPNMKIWDDLVNAKWFFDGMPTHAHQGLKSWREHMKARDESLAKKVLLEQTRDGNVAAAKSVLAESKKKAPVGRKNNKKVDDPVNNRVLAFKKKMDN